MAVAFPSSLWSACAAGGLARGGFVLQEAPWPELNRYFAVRHLDSSWCFQSEARSRERRRVEILATNGYKANNSYGFCVRAREPELCQERCATASPSGPLQELLETWSLTFGGLRVEASLPSSLSSSALGWPSDFWETPWDACEPDGALPPTARSHARIVRRRRHAVPDVFVHMQTEEKAELKFPNSLGRFRDSGLDYQGAVLYVHTGEFADIWPPLFLRHYSSSDEWCVEMGWCYCEGCYESSGPSGRTCNLVQDGCRQGVEVMCLREGRWRIRDWTQANPDLAFTVAKLLEGCCPDALTTLPGVHQNQAGLARLYLLLGNYRAWDAARLSAVELPPNKPPARGQLETRLRNRHVIVIRVPKASSSTLASLFVRIGRKLGHLLPTGAGEKGLRRRWSKRPLMLASRHVLPRLAWDLWTATLPEFLAVASIRHPFKRCLSSFYYEHYTQEEAPNKDAKLAWLRSSCDSRRFTKFTTCCGNFQYEFLSLWQNQTVSDLVSRYDFFFVTERMEDSLLAFRAQWNLTFDAMLHVQVKSSSKRQVCNFLDRWDGYAPKRKKTQEEPEVMDFGHSSEFTESNWADIAIWRAANARLDASLATLDPEALARDRQHLKSVLSMAVMCEDLATKHCTDCLHEDIGCAQHCLDTVADYSPIFVGNS